MPRWTSMTAEMFEEEEDARGFGGQLVMGPVSEALEGEVRSYVRKHGLTVWLDADGDYCGFVEGLKAERAVGGLPYDVYSFRTSHLRLLLELEQVASGTEQPQLLVHLPGFNEESVRQSPFFELYAAGTRYRKALETLITEAAAGKARPTAIEAFKAQSGLTLEGADAWLSGLLVASDGGFAADLQRSSPTAFVEDLLSRGNLSSRLGEEGAQSILWERASVRLGLPAVWQQVTLPSKEKTPEDIAYCISGWCLAVEYVDDLRREPVSSYLQGVRALPKTVIASCREVASYLRERHERSYQRFADDVEDLLVDEVDQAKAEELGRVDTFRFEELTILDGALQALEKAEWAKVIEWSRPRTESTSEVSFWLRSDVARLSVWQLVHSAAHLGQQIERAGAGLFGPEKERSHEGAIERYVGSGALVDQAFRYLEQRRGTLLKAELPDFERLRERLDAMREHYRVWADAWARDYSVFCRSEGFLPGPSWQQRTLFDEVVRPMTQEAGVTAYFVVDALRYEMALELASKIDGGDGTTSQLKARLAELPTVTEVGMNVLAPVQQNGKLSPAFNSAFDKITGFQTAVDFRVYDPDTRKRAMHDRVGGNACPWLKLGEVLERDSASLKRTVAQSRLIVVHSEEIDQAGEKGAGLSVFDGVLQKLRSAWQLLRDAGVRRFVFTADHGFLLLEGAAKKVQSHGRKCDPDRRHVFSKEAVDHSGEVRVACSKLGYDSAPGYLMFPETTAVFDQGQRGCDFAHGGNSLTERVIPVLSVVHRGAAGGTVAAFKVSATVAQGVAGMHCVEITVEPLQTSFLDFGGPSELEIGLELREASEAKVELCQTRGKARLASGVIAATVGQRFELFFRLTAPTTGRAQVAIVSRAVQTQMDPFVFEEWFDVTAERLSRVPVPPVVSSGWAEALPEGGVREVFQHLFVHGSITETELSSMLGGPRGARKFANTVQDYEKKVPFRVRAEVVGNVKRYVKEIDG